MQLNYKYNTFLKHYHKVTNLPKTEVIIITLQWNIVDHDDGLLTLDDRADFSRQASLNHDIPQSSCDPNFLNISWNY